MGCVGWVGGLGGWVGLLVGWYMYVKSMLYIPVTARHEATAGGIALRSRLSQIETSTRSFVKHLLR